MVEKKEPKIIQIIPAVDWYAVFDEGTPEEFRMPLTCWALTNEGDVVGQIATENFIDSAESANNFSSYTHKSGKAEPLEILSPEELAERQAEEEQAVAAAMKELELG